MTQKATKLDACATSSTFCCQTPLHYSQLVITTNPPPAAG
jgi:hypothetical protein